MTTLVKPTVTVCEMVDVMDFAHRQIFGHPRSVDDKHGLNCACPGTWNAPAVTLGDERAERLVCLLTKFAYRVHTPDEQTEMLALIKEARP